MAHFAKLNENNVVETVIVVSNEDILDLEGNESEEIGITFCQQLLPGRWIQTSYNGTFRGIFASSGFLYDEVNDVFVAPVEPNVSSDATTTGV